MVQLKVEFCATCQTGISDRHTGYMEQHRKATERLAGLGKRRRERQNKFLMLEIFIKEIETRPLYSASRTEQMLRADISSIWQKEDA